MPKPNPPVSAATPFEEAIARAKMPGELHCQICNEGMFSPMDKLSIILYGKCLMHLEEGSTEEKNILTLTETL